MRNLTLMLMRHGKAAREEGVADDARRLEKRGRIEVASVAIRALENDLRVDGILYSPAARTAGTAGIFAAIAAPEAETMAVEALYLGSPETLWRRAVAALDSVDRLLLVGHNPAVTAVVHRLCGGRRRDDVKTSELFVFEGCCADGKPLSLAEWTPVLRIRNTGEVDALR